MYFDKSKETMYLVTDIYIDTPKGGDREFDAEEASDVTQDAIGLWYARAVSYTHLTLPTICRV